MLLSVNQFSDFSPETGKSWAVFVLPPPELSKYIRAFMFRSTVGAGLEGEQLLTYIPSNPLCKLVFHIHGNWQMTKVADPEGFQEVPCPLEFMGPHLQPVVLKNIGDIHYMSVLLLPDAVPVLLGFDVSKYIDVSRPIGDVISAQWRSVCDDVLAARTDIERIEIFCKFIAYLAKEVPDETSVASRTLSQWRGEILLRAATSGVGKSVRQIERRIRSWTGLQSRYLRRIGRGESLLLSVRKAQEEIGRIDWVDLALSNEFSDQSHLCREVLELTGMTPDVIRKKIFTDESMWVYRMWQ